MRITQETAGDVTILHAEGKLRIGDGDVALREAVRSAVESGRTRLLLDLGKVTTIDSSGLGELVNAIIIAQSHDGTLKLVSVPEKVAGVLQITQLAGVFEIYDDEIEAIASF
jgi:anti-sigma B factor antagonist